MGFDLPVLGEILHLWLKYDTMQPTGIHGGAKVEFTQKENDCPDYHYSSYDTVLYCIFRIFDVSAYRHLEICPGDHTPCVLGNHDLCLHRKNK